jgi:hypothetical protein
MVIDLDATPPVHVPEGIEIRLFDDRTERRRLHEVLEEAFADHWEHRPRAYEEWAKRVYEVEGYDPTLVWVALAEESLGVGVEDLGDRARVLPAGLTEL